MAGKGNGGAGGDGGNILWSIIWFLILIFIGYETTSYSLLTSTQFKWGFTVSGWQDSVLDSTSFSSPSPSASKDAR